MKLRFVLFAFSLISACSLFRDVDSVAPSDTPDGSVGADLRMDAAGPADIGSLDAAEDFGSDATTCTPLGAGCDASSVCCSLGECNVQGTCSPRPCTVSDDCAGLQCVRLDGSLEARGCLEPQCPDCEGQNWCHPVVGCTNRDPCSNSDTCSAAEVCTSDSICLETCDSSSDCGARECVALTPAELASTDDLNARVCRPATCNCRDPDDFCALDGVCVRSNVACQADVDCGGAPYACDGVRCVCDDADPDQCRFGCATNADCSETQVCDVALRRCQTRHCAFGGDCPAGFVCAPEAPPPWAALICRASGPTEVGEACSVDGDCETAICRDGVCRQTCRQTGDCPTDHDCVFAQEWLCASRDPVGACDEPCDDDLFCLTGNICQPFCTKTSECPEGLQCVTGFNIYNCNPTQGCGPDEVLNYFTEECITFCWVDEDCPSGDCDEKINSCREAG